LGSQPGTLWIEVLRELPDTVRIDVVDDGPGIPEALRDTLFQPFVSTKSEGTGLGLYVCSLLARLAGGSLEAITPERGGVCMRLRLPEAT
jgi:two-component system sensor kinase FixL